MDWKRLPAYITGSVDQELLLRNEYLAAENRILGERLLLLALNQYLTHHHHERNHQGKDNLLLFPSSEQTNPAEGPVCCRDRLGRLLKYYYRDAA